MRSKRLLTLVVALCMLVSLMAPAANAVQINNAKPETNENATITTNKFNDLLASVGNALGIPNLRDKFMGATNGEGDWSVTPSDKESSADKHNAQLPEHIQKLGPHHHIQSRCRLIQNQELCIVRQRHNDFKFRFHTGGKLF